MNLNVRRKTTRTLPKKFKQLKSRREQSRRVVRTVNPTQAHESRIYSDYALLYDKTFGKIFYNRIKHVIESLHIPPGAAAMIACTTPALQEWWDGKKHHSFTR